MEYEAPLDSLATVHGWAQGSPTRPFVSIVNLYMTQQMDVSSAVEEIVSVLNVKYQLGDMNIIDEYLTDLWHTLTHTSKKTPHKPPSPSYPPDQPTPPQKYLLSLLHVLKTQPPPPAIPQKHPPAPTQPAALVWADLPLFAQSVRSALRDAPGLGKCGFSEAETTGWENFTAFVALVARDLLGPGSSSSSSGDGGGGGEGLEAVAVRMIRLALEERHDDGGGGPSRSSGLDYDVAAAVDAEILLGGDSPASPSAEEETGDRRLSSSSSQTAPAAPIEKANEATKLNVYVACAALWAIIMGEELWERKGDKIGSVVGITVTTRNRRQSLFREGIPLPRWEMWTNRLEFLSRREDLRIETRELAAEGAAVMRRVF